MGPPQGKRAPRVGPISIAILARERTTTDWKQCHGSHGFHTTRTLRMDACSKEPPWLTGGGVRARVVKSHLREPCVFTRVVKSHPGLRGVRAHVVKSHLRERCVFTRVVKSQPG